MELALDVEAFVAILLGGPEFEGGEAVQFEDFAAGGQSQLLSLQNGGGSLGFAVGLEQGGTEEEAFRTCLPERDAFAFKMELILFIHIIVKLKLFKFCALASRIAGII